ncbi:MAG: glycoside hydrolase family 38 C-terminal domain-containing protein [Thermotogota bacterium]|nr:glycoside hydrolase family 38 C-terminal domain-containing protein [Thermotogota bacterium]
MYDSYDRKYVKYKRMISDILPYVLISRKELKQWDFASRNNEKKENSIDKKIDFGESWSAFYKSVLFKRMVKIPVINSDEIINLKAWFGGESLVKVDGKPFGEINEYQKELDLSVFADDNEHLIEVQVVPHGLLGQRVKKPVFEKAELIIEHRTIKRIIRGFYLVNELIKETDGSVLKDLLLDLLDKTLRKIDIPRDTGSYFKAVCDNHEVFREVSWIWNAENFVPSKKNSYSEKLINNIIDAEKEFKREMAFLKEKFPSYGKISMIGHAHVDYAWLWPISETKNKIVRTFSNALRLIDKYDDFKYIQSSAKMYDDLKKQDPELFAKIQRKVKDGRWVLTGGMWVESDCNIPSPESLIRQIFYGQSFFGKHFGKKCEIAWLPDVFGFSWLLPQILADAGINYFFTTKLTWNETSRFPYDLCIWKGLDGSEVIYHSFENVGEGYNGKINPEEIIGTWKNYRQKKILPETLFTFGYGDGGGGPTDEMIENYLHMKDFPSFPELSIDNPLNFYKKVGKKKRELPVWDGELYLELHRGTLTTQSRTKMLHKKAEDELFLAELFSMFIDNNPVQKKLDDLWKTLLHNEFHDILPGSSIREVYETAEKELSEIIEKAKDIKNTGLLNFVTHDEKTIIVFNPGSHKRPLLFEADLKGKTLSMESGKSLKIQKTQNGWLYFGEAMIDPFSSMKLFVREKEAPVKNDDISSDDRILENSLVRIIVNEDGTIKMYDKVLGREVFEDSGNKLFLYDDVPPKWDAWDIDIDYEKSARQLKASEIKRVETGEIKQSFEVKYRFNDTIISQDYILHSHSKRLDIKTNIDWHHRKTLLRAIFPVNVLSRKAKYDIGTGYIERPTHKNTDFEKARFETIAHRWMDLTEAGFGVSLLNDGKYGHSCSGNVMGISLLRSPVFPHFFADEGKHSFTYSIYPHKGDEVLNTIKQAEQLNKPLIVAKGTPTTKKSLVNISEENFKVLALKRGKHGEIILRIAEITGKRGSVDIMLNNFEYRKVWKSNILEEKKEELILIDKMIKLEYRPFKIYTLIFE